MNQMDAMNSPFANLKTGWWSFSLPGYRDHPEPTTYSLFSFEQLPRLEVPGKAGWAWLEKQPFQEEWSLADNAFSDGSLADLSRLHELAEQIAFPLPDDFIQFFESPDVHRRIRSCTACMLVLGDFPARTTDWPGGVLIQFLVDQQGVLRWYLFADSDGNEAVLVSGEEYGVYYDLEEPPRREVDLAGGQIWLCAPTFREFMYRFWLENEVWFALDERSGPASTLQREYLNHYR